MTRALCGKVIPEEAPTALSFADERSCESCLRIAAKRAFIATVYRKRVSWHIPKPAALYS